MNNIKIIILTSLRTYASKSEIAGIRGPIKLRKTEGSDIDIEEFQDDLGAYESVFRNVGESYNTYKRETREAKEKLKRNIVKSKYFKEVQPNFLTYIEKDQIRKLHKSNPEEWTPEKLSESFPALSETIKKVLKSKWNPNSVDSIMKYDNQVIENWKNFKTGKLVVNPMLNEHLMKFKHRHISLTDRKLVENFVPLKMEFPKPISQMFSTIINDCDDNKKSKHNEKLISSRSNEVDSKENDEIGKNRNTECDKYETRMVVKDASINIKVNNKNSNYKKGKKLTFNEFLKEKLENLYKGSPEEAIVLLNTYRKQMESKNTEDISANVENAIKTGSDNKETSITVAANTLHKVEILVEKSESSSKVALAKCNDTSFDTYVKEWKTSIETKFEYAKCINVPKNVYKIGMTYRIKDCYYDDDGEFLYRVPGVWT